MNTTQGQQASFHHASYSETQGYGPPTFRSPPDGQHIQAKPYSPSDQLPSAQLSRSQDGYSHPRRSYDQSTHPPPRNPPDQQPHSRDKPPHSRDQPPHNRDQPPHSRDQPPHSREQTPSNRGQQPHSRDQPPHNRDQPPYSRDQPPHSRDQPPHSRDQMPSNHGQQPHSRDQPPHNRDQPPYNRDQLPHSRDQRPSNRGQQPHSRDQPPHSRDQPPHNRDQPPHNREQPPHSRGQPPHNRDQPPHSRDQPPHNRDQPPHSGDQTPSSRGQQPHSRVQPPHSRDQPPHSRGQPPHNRHQRSQNRDQPPNSRDKPPHNHDQPSHNRDQPPHNRDQPSHTRDQPPHSSDQPPHSRDQPHQSQPNQQSESRSTRPQDQNPQYRPRNELKRAAPAAPHTSPPKNTLHGNDTNRSIHDDQYIWRNGSQHTSQHQGRTEDGGGSVPQAPPRSSSKNVAQKYNGPQDTRGNSHTPNDVTKAGDFRNRSQQYTTADSPDNNSKGFTNQGYVPDSTQVYTHDPKPFDNDRVQYRAADRPHDDRYHPNHDTDRNKYSVPLRDTENRKKYSSTTAINSSSTQASQSQDDPLQNPYARPPHGSAQNKYGSMSALHSQLSPGSVQRLDAKSGAPEQQVNGSGYHGSAPGYHGSASSYHGSASGYPTTPPKEPPNYLQAGSLPQGRTLAELDKVTSPQSPPHSQDGRKYEKRISGNPSQSQAPRKTKRGRILSQHDPNQQRSPTDRTPTQGSGNPGGFNSAPPARAHSISNLHISLSTNPNGTASNNLYRPQSVPNISGAVSAQEMRASTTSLNRSGQANGGTGIWRSKSVLELALTSEGSNLQRSQSVVSLIAANPKLARAASIQALYEMKVEQGKVPRDHYQTFVLSIIACVLFPFTGIPLLIMTVKNKPEWKENLHEASIRNNRLFWGAILSNVVGALMWLTIIIVICLNFA